MRLSAHRVLIILSLVLIYLPRVAAQDWAPITDTEKEMKANPLDPGAGAVVLFKHGDINVQESPGFWLSSFTTYTRIKILNDAGRDYANVSLESWKDLRLSKIEGRTILPSGEIIPLDPASVHRGVALEAGRNYAMLKTSFTFPSVQPGAIIEYRIQEFEDGYFTPSWIFDTPELATLQSTLRLTVGARLAMHALPVSTSISKIATTFTDIANGHQFDFAVQNLRPIRPEPYSLPYRDQATLVMFSPYAQSFSGRVYPIITSWDDVAGGFNQALDDIEKADSDANKQASELTDKLSDERARAQAIYSYIQQNIASSGLASITLDRTVDAVLTAKRGSPYELNALLVVMLKHAKVDAGIAVIGGQDYQTIVKTFPNYDQFGRVITHINLKSGAIFADAAATGTPFGELPWYEKGLTAMVVKGGKMVETDIPYGVPEENTSTTKVSLQVTPDWRATGSAEVDMTGAEAIRFRGDYREQAPSKMEENLADYFAYGKSDAEVSDIVHPDFNDATQPVMLKAKVQERLVGQTGPGQVLVNPWLDDQYSSPIFKASERHSTIRFENPEKRVSTSVWQLPTEIKVVNFPRT